MEQNKQPPGFHTVRGYELANKEENLLTPAMEDYLEMACRLCGQYGYTRVGKLSERLNVRPSSVSKMVAKLVELGYLRYDQYESIRLTEKGRKTGAYLIHRHNTVARFLRLLGMDDSLQETELMEHNLSVQTVARLAALLLFFEQQAGVAAAWKRFCQNDGKPAAPPGQR